MSEVYLYGDKTIKVDRDRAEVLSRGVLPLGIGGVGFGSSSNLATGSHHLRVVLVFRAWHGNEHESGSSSLEREVQRDVSVRSSSCGTYRDVLRSPFDR